MAGSPLDGRNCLDGGDVECDSQLVGADPLLSAGCPLVDAIADWAEYLASPDDQGWMGDFRAATRSGRPVGSASFVELIEARLDRRLRVGSRGRPRKRAFTIEK